MSVMVNARANDYWATRHVLILKCKNVSKSYLDVLLKRMLDNGLIQRKEVPLGRKKVWGYKGTEIGQEWWLNPTKYGRVPTSSKRLEVVNVPLEETIERDGWVERWNEQVIRITNYTGEMIRKRMHGQRKGDRAKQRKYDCAAFFALTSYSKRTGYTLRLRFRLEPWREHLARWLGQCGIPIEAVETIVNNIEKQLPGSFKQQEHRVIGSFGTAVRRLEGKIKITSTEVDSGKKGITEVEYSRSGDLQVSGDAEIVDGIIGGLAGWQNSEVIRIARESGEKERMEKLILLLAQGKNKEVQKMLGVDPEDEDDDDTGADYYV